MFYVCVNILFWRVFMRISYACPAHLKLALSVEKWTELVQLSRHVIDWLDAHEQLYDVWLLVAYCATSCALVQVRRIIAISRPRSRYNSRQYHTWARRRDPEAQLKLKKLRDCIRKWEASLSPDHMSARRKARLRTLTDTFVLRLLTSASLYRRRRSLPSYTRQRRVSRIQRECQR